MSDIKNELKKVIEETMIPETEDFLEELHEELTEENKETIRDMESFLVELQNILLAIKENKITDDETQEVYDKIMAMLDEEYQED